MRRTAGLMIAAALAGSAITVATTQLASGQTATEETVFVPVVPCRLVDTRPDTNIGPRATPLPAGQAVTFNAHDGSDADSTCEIPTSATAVSTNVTAVGANAPSFLTLWPTGAARPGTSNLNYLPGAPPTPNAVNLPLATNGQFDVFNRNGTIDVIIDVNGYYQPSTSIGATGPAGPTGPVGPTGPSGPQGPDGPTTRQHGRQFWSQRTLDSTGFFGSEASIALDPFGNPVVAFYDSDGGDLEISICTDPTCADVPNEIQLDTAGNTGLWPSLAIGPTGNPVVAYHDFSNDELELAICLEPTCASAPARRTVGGPGFIGLHASVTIGTSGLPIVAYDDADDDLRVLACLNPTCTVDFDNEIDADADPEHTQITIGPDGNPIIAYHARAFGRNELMVASCGNPTCTVIPTRSVVDTNGSVGSDVSLAIGVDGNPIMSYRDESNRTLKIAACVDPRCVQPATITVADDTDNAGYESSIVIGLDGLPIISYLDFDNSDLEFARCLDRACTQPIERYTLDTDGETGRDSSMTLGINGDPLIAFHDADDGELRLATVAQTSFTPSNWDS